MASIFGLKLKCRRSFQGRDWEGNQGNLYIGNIKIAWYNDSGDGAPADIEYYEGRVGRDKYEPQLNEIVKKYYAKHPLEEQYKNLEPDNELLIGALLELMDDEKQYKKYAKEGYPIMIAYRKTENGVAYYGAFQSKDVADAYIEKHKLIVLKRYETIEEFDIK